MKQSSLQKLHDMATPGEYEEFICALAKEVADCHCNVFEIKYHEWYGYGENETVNELRIDSDTRHEHKDLIFAKDNGSDQWKPIKPCDIKPGQDIELRAELTHVETDYHKDMNWTALGKVNDCYIRDRRDGVVFIETDKGLFTNSHSFCFHFQNAVYERNTKAFALDIPGAEERLLTAQRREKANEPIPAVTINDVDIDALEGEFEELDSGCGCYSMDWIGWRLTNMHLTHYPTIEKEDLSAIDWVNQKKFALAMAYYAESRGIKTFVLDGLDFERSNAACENKDNATRHIFAREEDCTKEVDWRPIKSCDLSEGFEVKMMTALNRLDNDTFRAAQWTNIGVVQDVLENTYTGEIFILTDKGMFTNSKDFEIGYKDLVREWEERDIGHEIK